jgi:polyisoprenoid-binding protein YceI
MRAPTLLASLSAPLLAAALALPAAAQTAPTWVVNQADSRLGFVATQSGSEVEGDFGEWTADIAFDPETATGRIEAVVQTASVATGSRDRDESLKGDGLLHVEAYPEARFVADSFETVGESAYEATGQLTLRGTTRDVALPFTLDVSGDDAQAEGELVVNRLDYGVGQGQWEDTSVVGAEVRIVFEISATRQ